MTKFILATKEEMTQLFDDEGRARAVTVLTAGPMTAVQVKTKEKDGYEAVQFGFGTRKEKNINKPLKGHLKGKGAFAILREHRFDAPTQAEGDVVDVSVFAPGDVVEVSALSKAKGFQGVVKRHNFSGGPRTHGQKHNERFPGSIGGGLRTRVPKGMRMGGRTGGTRISVKNLKVLHVDSEKGMLYVSGAVPGRRGTLVEVRGIAK